jgi:predicted transcriptional regulator
MTRKQIVEDSLERIQDQDIEFVLAVRQGLAELDRGEHIPIEEVESELSSWITK